MKCAKCGSDLAEGAKFCPLCGEKVSSGIFSNEKIKSEPSVEKMMPQRISESSMQQQIGSKEKKKEAKYCHKTEIVMIIISLFFLIATLYNGKTISVIFSVMQLGAVIVALLIHKNIIKSRQSWLECLVLFISIFIGVLNILSHSWSQDSFDDKIISGRISEVYTPYSAQECVGKDYEMIKNSFMKVGFTNISVEIIEDLEASEMNEVGIVESVSINGMSDFGGNTEFKSSSKVIITYHSLKYISIPISSEKAANMNVQEVVDAFEKAGFTEITTDEVYDLDPDVIESDFENHISINGMEIFDKGTKAPINSEIKIITHRPYEKYTLKIVIDFASNLIFSTYDVAMEIDNNVETLKHGKDGEFEYRVKPGKYKIIFSSTESDDIRGTAELEISGDTEASYKISCYSDKVNVETLYIENKGAIGENEAMVPLSASNCISENHNDIEKSFKEAGFTNISKEILYDIVFGVTDEGSVEQVAIDGNVNFRRGDIFAKDTEIVITYHMKEEDNPDKKEETETEKESKDSDVKQSESKTSISTFYSTNDYETATKGNSGVFSYCERTASYDIYWIIDFEDGYVYYFTDGDGETFCDKLKIESGDLNAGITITYHEGGTVWSNRLHFKYENHPETLIVRDHNGFKNEYSTTDLDDALSIRDTKTITEY